MGSGENEQRDKGGGRRGQRGGGGEEVLAASEGQRRAYHGNTVRGYGGDCLGMSHIAGIPSTFFFCAELKCCISAKWPLLNLVSLKIILKYFHIYFKSQKNKTPKHKTLLKSTSPAHPLEKTALQWLNLGRQTASMKGQGQKGSPFCCRTVAPNLRPGQTTYGSAQGGWTQLQGSWGGQLSRRNPNEI